MLLKKRERIVTLHLYWWLFFRISYNLEWSKDQILCGPNISIYSILVLYMAQAPAFYLGNFMEMWFGGLKREFWYMFESKRKKNRVGLEYMHFHEPISVTHARQMLRNYLKFLIHSIFHANPLFYFLPQISLFL